MINPNLSAYLIGTEERLYQLQLGGQRVTQTTQSRIAYWCNLLSNFWRRTEPIPLETEAQQLDRLKTELTASIPETRGFVGKDAASKTFVKRQKALKALIELAKKDPSLKTNIVDFLDKQLSRFSNEIKYKRSHSGIIFELKRSSQELSPNKKH